MKTGRDSAQPKIGSEHAGAMLRLGLSELRGAFFNESNTAQPAQYGLYGTKTPGEVMQDRGTNDRDPEEKLKSILDDCLHRAGVRDECARDSRNLEKE